MKVLYQFQSEEITTCNGCPFCHYNDIQLEDYCSLTTSKVTDHCFENTKDNNCPLQIIINEECEKC